MPEPVRLEACWIRLGDQMRRNLYPLLEELERKAIRSTLKALALDRVRKIRI